MSAPRFYALGDAALVCAAEPPATLDAQLRVWGAAARARTWPHVVDVVPGMNNLSVMFNPLATSAAELEPLLRAVWDAAGGGDQETSDPEPEQSSGAAPHDLPRFAGRDIDLPVRYGGADGPDLEAVAAHTGLSPDEVIRRHAAGTYLVYFIGFQPGFAYLGGLDTSLHTPRRAAPRLEVPAGAVGIGGAQTGIYPAASPGGWQLIGRTALRLFDPAQDPPTLLQPGDRVRFVAVAQP